ncbi:MAG: ATP synthase F1 subunit epsilon [Phototrophicaceae bacterium]
MPIHVEIITQEKKIFDEPLADMVIIPATEGEMGVLPHHAPVLTTMSFGELTVRKGQREEHFAIYGGVVDIRPDKVVVLADMAESAADLDIAALETARATARRLIEQGIPGAMNREATLSLRRAELALKVKSRLKDRNYLRILGADDEA